MGLSLPTFLTFCPTLLWTTSSAAQHLVVAAAATAAAAGTDFLPVAQVKVKSRKENEV